MTRALKPLNAIKVATWWETADCVWHSSLLAGIPVWLVQDVDSAYYQNDELAQIRVLSDYRPEFVYLVNSPWIVKYFEQELLYQSHFIGLGIDDIYVSGEGASTQKSKRSLLVCARGESLKGFEYSKQLVRHLLELGFSITAFGLDEKLISDLPGVTFYKQPTDAALKKLYWAHEYFLQTSIHEGFGLPALEAMACGCIPIVTMAGGNEDYIRDRVNAVVIPRDFASAVEKIDSLEYEQLFSQLSDGMKETVDAYRWSECLPRLSALFKAISMEPVFGKTKYL
jgi:glycosyltransferase involved in cell wall biosynthesis